MDTEQNHPEPARSGRGCLKWIGILLLILAVIPLVYYGLYFLLRGPKPTRVQVIAHRGGRAQAPENTLAAFRKGIQSGADQLEMDIQRSKDGQLVVMHDATVDRTTDGSGRVADLTFDQLRLLDAGSGEQVPTFAEVIQLAKGAGVRLLPEAKNPELYPELEDEMVAALRQQDFLGQTILQSFVRDRLEKAAQANPDLQVCPLYGLWELSLRAVQPASAKYVCPMAEMVLLNPWMIRQAHQSGRQAFVWFGAVENPLLMRLMLALGADGLIVDDPVRLGQILGRNAVK
jgi:glycerophosphoryl diester phosphodiesterase